MRDEILRRLSALAPVFLAGSLLAANPIQNVLTMGFGDVAEIKKKAEAGDAFAQVKLADSLASNLKATEALQWYRKAAAQGNVEGKYHVGQMLLFGAPGIPTELAVKPNPTEGLRWTFMAATNFHPNACWNMGKALSRGLGTSTNLIGAYAWLKLFSETGSGSIVGKVEMNQLALKLDAGSLQQGQNLAARFKAGEWQIP
jgi:TPR repeat protein